MKLLIAAITFAATLGVLFLIEAGESPKEDYAQIIETLKTEASITPTLVKTPKQSSPSPQNSPANQSAAPTPTKTSTSAPTPSATPAPAPEQSEKININTASLEELDKITGVGPIIGQRIIDYRNTNGPFQKIEDIKNVKGIGDVTFEKMKDEITI